MPISTSEPTSAKANVSAAYLKFIDLPENRTRGALFTVTPRGEPLEFVFNQVIVPAHFLWKGGEARRTAVRLLCQSLFQATSREPDLILALAEEVPPRVFLEDIKVLVPICRIASAGAIVSAEETAEILGEDAHLFWAGTPPNEDDPARALIEVLWNSESLLEPFERAAIGIDEAFAQL